MIDRIRNTRESLQADTQTVTQHLQLVAEGLRPSMTLSPLVPDEARRHIEGLWRYIDALEHKAAKLEQEG